MGCPSRFAWGKLRLLHDQGQEKGGVHADNGEYTALLYWQCLIVHRRPYRLSRLQKKKPRADLLTLNPVLRLLTMLGDFLMRKGEDDPGAKTMWIGLHPLWTPSSASSSCVGRCRGELCISYASSFLPMSRVSREAK